MGSVEEKLVRELGLEVFGDALNQVLAGQPIQHHKLVCRCGGACDDEERSLNVLAVPGLGVLVELVENYVARHVDDLCDGRIATLEHA